MEARVHPGIGTGIVAVHHLGCAYTLAGKPGCNAKSHTNIRGRLAAPAKADHFSTLSPSYSGRRRLRELLGGPDNQIQRLFPVRLFSHDLTLSNEIGYGQLALR